MREKINCRKEMSLEEQQQQTMYEGGGGIEEEWRIEREWFQIHGPSLLSASSFLALLIFTQIALPQHTPKATCVFSQPVNDVLVWLLVPLCVVVIGMNTYNTVMRNRAVKGKQASWLPTRLTWISAVTLVMMTLSTLCYGFSYKFIPMTQREGWILHECNSFNVIRFCLIYGVFLLNAFIPMFFFPSSVKEQQ